MPCVLGSQSTEAHILTVFSLVHCIYLPDQAELKGVNTLTLQRSHCSKHDWYECCEIRRYTHDFTHTDTHTLRDLCFVINVMWEVECVSTELEETQIHSDNLKWPCQCLWSSVVKHVAVHVSFPHSWASSVLCSNNVLSLSLSCRPSPHFVLYNIFLPAYVCACTRTFPCTVRVCVRACLCLCVCWHDLTVTFNCHTHHLHML